MDVDDHHAARDELGLGPDADSVRSVLVIRPGGVASVVRAVPALRHVRAAYARARVDVVAEAPARELLDACPYVDRVIASEQPSEALIECYDIAISWAAPDDSSALSVDDVNARFRASWRSEGGRQRRAIHPEWPERMDAASRMLRLAWLLGGELGDHQHFGLWPSLADRNGAAALVSDSMRPLALVHAREHCDSDRVLGIEEWGALVDMLDAIGLDPVLVGGADDVSCANRVLERVRHVPMSLVGRTTVGQTCGLLERAALFVGVDLAPAALASALDVRSVVIGPTSPYEFDCRPGRVELVAVEDTPVDVVLGRVKLVAGAALEHARRQERIA